MAPHSSILAWRIPWTEEPGGLQSMGLLRVEQYWVTSLSLFTFKHWRRTWQPTAVFLPGESQGQGAWWAAVDGVAQSQTWLKRLSSRSSSRHDRWLYQFCVCVCVKSIVMMLYWDNLGYARCFNFKGIHSCFSLILILDYHPSSCIERWAQISCLSFLLIRREVTFFGCLPS